MLFKYSCLSMAALSSTAAAATLDDVCTNAYAKASLPSDSFYPGITIDASSVTATPYTDVSVVDEYFYPNAVFDYCNVTFAYAHNGRDDQVLVTYWLPTPDNFQNRYLSTGGGGFAINSGNSSLPGGVIYGAVAGMTDGGFGSFDTQYDAVFLLQNNTVNWESTYMFGYQGIHEMTLLGKQFTKQFFNMSDTKLYSYYQGCSEGGREGWSQVQRFGEELDGVITGAPAFRFAFQQVQHLYSDIVEQTLDYYPSLCELDKIVTETISACDPLDGKTDGVVARTDLCLLHFNATSIVGKSYDCPADGATPAQNGTVSAKAVQVTNKIIDGLHDSQGRRVYFSYQPSANFTDATTQYNATSQSWGLDQNTMGGEYVEKYLKLQNATVLPSLANVTYDTLKEWCIQGWQTYQDSLETTWPDLTPFQAAGGKILHYHGESDFSIPTASSVRYHESVRSIMYPKLSYNASTAELSKWYRLYLVPGAGHCAPNYLEPNGPFPQTNLAVLIDWVEKGVQPTTLNATVLQGEHQGENQQICAWPLRPYWTKNGTVMECQYDQASIDSWHYDLDAIKLPVY